MEHDGLKPAQRPGDRQRRDRRRGQRRDRYPGAARLSRGRADRQGEGDRLPASGSARRKSCCARVIDLAKIRPLDKATWAGAVDNLGGDVLAWLLSTMKHRRHGRQRRACRGLQAQHHGDAVHPARRAAARRRQRECPMPLRQKVWERLATTWRPSRVAGQGPHDRFDDLPTCSTRTSIECLERGNSGRSRPHRRAQIGRRHRRGTSGRVKPRRMRMGAYAEFHRRSIADRDAFWGEQAALIDWQTPFSAGARLQPAAVRALVRRRPHQSLPQRGRPPSRDARRAAGAGLHLDRDRAAPHLHLSRAARRSQPLRRDAAARRASARATAC